MDKETFVSTLQQYVKESGGSLREVEQDAYEMVGRASSRNAFIQFTLTAKGHVTEIRYARMCGVARAPRAFLQLLTLNFGGVTTGAFYFSALLNDNDVLVFLEAKKGVGPNFDRDGFYRVISEFEMDPIWVRRWDFPKGVDNMLW